ncbi:MAG: hypothetical protein NTY80_02005 [candidate division SR1 bacterium]|nr:hypothetical protein [candidate division SR1 bacterium]
MKNVFKKLWSLVSPKSTTQKLIDPKNLLPIYVKMESWDTLMDEEKFKTVLKGKLKGKYAFTIVFCEPDGNRTFFLTDESDFEAFSTAIKTIEGVIDVVKGKSEGKQLLEELGEKLVNKNLKK